MGRETFYQLGLRLRRQQQRDWQRHKLAYWHDQPKQTDLVALCCYFDRVARTLTLGEQHFGLIPAPRRHKQTETLTLCCYGVEVRLADEAGLGLCQRLRDTLPPEFGAASEPSAVAVTYAVTAVASPGRAGASEFLIACDGAPVFATSIAEELYWWLRRDIEQVIARRSPQMLFVHAGVVGWRGLGIVIPGRGSSGKSTLVAALVRRGAVYYSDTFAVLDHAGRVHPYRELIGLGVEGYSRNLRLVREDGQVEPLPIGLIVDGAYSQGTAWRPAIVRGPHAALSLVDSIVPGREQAARLPQLKLQLAADAVGLRGPRGEAEEAAAQLLDLVEDALVCQALGAARSAPLAADGLARVAERRLCSPDRPSASPERHLIAPRYVRMPDFLAPGEHQHLLQQVLAGNSIAWEPQAIEAEDFGDLHAQARMPRTRLGKRYHEIWQLLGQRLLTILPFVREQLQQVWFPVGRIEWQLTAHSPGRAVAPHADAEEAQGSGPHVSCIYFFHPAPKRFSGGELKLYDTWMTPDGNSCAGTYTTLAPADNSIVFFPSEIFREVRPIDTETSAIAQGCFSITIRFWKRPTPTQDGNQAGRATSAGTAGALAPDSGNAPEPPPKQARRATSGPRPRRRVAVVVPTHRFPLAADEQLAIRHLRAHLGEFDRYMIGPAAPPAEFSDFALAPAPANNYVDRPTYNHLLMTKPFYEAFAGYEYILIYQLDCLVFSNTLEAWCRKGYDYIGSPWFNRWHQFQSEQSEYAEDIVDGLGTVGNGGFSLRKVDTALAVLAATERSQHYELRRTIAVPPEMRLYEDQFWSFQAPALVDTFRIPKAREALQFSFENQPRYCYRENGYRLPFGCHGWNAWDREFWQPFLLR